MKMSNFLKSRKRAVLFTLLSVLLSALFLALFSSEFSYTVDDRATAADTRISVLDTYVKNFESYTDQSLNIATYKTLDSMYSYCILKNKFFNDSGDFNFTFAT